MRPSAAAPGAGQAPVPAHHKAVASIPSRGHRSDIQSGTVNAGVRGWYREGACTIMPRFHGASGAQRGGGAPSMAARGWVLDESPETDRDEGGSAAGPPERPRTVNLIVVAGAVVLMGLVAFALYRRSHTVAPVAEPATDATPAQTGAPVQGTPITATLPVRLTPEASIIAERYRCICSCNDPLNVCTCTKTPGSRDMREYVQELVNQKKSTAEVDQAM